MTDIPEDIMREARAVALEVLSHADGPILLAFNTVARALLAAEKRGAERERAEMHKLIMDAVEAGGTTEPAAIRREG